MATITEVLPRPTPAAQAHHDTGIWSWITTVDHKRIAVLYGATAFIMFLLGGIEALVMRLQLATPNGQLVDVPLSVAFFNYVVPLQIGARDVAFPRLNALSYWIFLAGGIFINLGWLIGSPPDGGWFGYANLTTRQFSP